MRTHSYVSTYPHCRRTNHLCIFISRSRSIQDTLSAALRSIPLTRLRLHVDVSLCADFDCDLFDFFSSGGPRPVPVRVSPPCTAETSAARIDVSALLRALCAAVPTLVDAYVALCRTAYTDLDRAPSGDEDHVGTADGEKETVREWARFPSGDETELEEEDRAKMLMFELYH